MLISPPPNLFVGDTQFSRAHLPAGKKLKKSKSANKIETVIGQHSPLAPSLGKAGHDSLKTKEIFKIQLKDYFYEDPDDANSETDSELISEQSILFESDGIEEKDLSTDIESLNQKFANLKENFYTLKDGLNGIIALIKQFLSFFEYCSDNKINLANLSRLILPEQAHVYENLLIYGDYGYKWIDSVIRFFAYSIKYQLIKEIQIESKEIEHSCKKFVHQDDKKIEASAQASINKIQKSIDQFHIKLERDKEEAIESSKLPHLVSKLLAELLTTLHTFLPIFKILRKTAEKVCKCFYEIYKNSKGLLECNRSNDIQNEWFFHLQPQQSTLVKNENPDLFEKEKVYFQEVIQKKLIENIKNFHHSLRKSQSISEVESLFKQINLSIKLPSTIEKFKQNLEIPRFRRELFQHYYYYMGQRIFLDEKRIKLISQKKQEEHHSKVSRSLPIVAQKIDECIDECKKLNLPFDHIKNPEGKTNLKGVKTYFREKLHIDISSSNLPKIPQNLLELEECLANEDFIKTLAEQWVCFQETTAQLSVQAIRRAVLSKVQVECEFLSFQKIQYVIGLVSSFIQLNLCLTPLKYLGMGQIVELFAIKEVLELLLTDLTKLDNPSLGLYYLGYPLYPGIKCKVESFATLFTKHFFAIKYEPHQYSLESYKLHTQIRLTKLIEVSNSLRFLMQQGLLWINVRLVDNCIRQMNTQPLVEDSSYIELTKKYEQCSFDLRQLFQNLLQHLKQLQIIDAKLIIHPHFPSSKEEPYDPIKILVDAIQDADIDYFPPNVLESFENLVGFELTNANKGKLQEHLEDFFIKKDQEFWRTYRDNRFAYLRA